MSKKLLIGAIASAVIALASGPAAADHIICPDIGGGSWDIKCMGSGEWDACFVCFAPGSSWTCAWMSRTEAKLLAPTSCLIPITAGNDGFAAEPERPDRRDFRIEPPRTHLPHTAVPVAPPTLSRGRIDPNARR